MPSVVIEVARPLDRVWRAFTNARLFAAWMPGLRRANVVSEENGLPTEVDFDFSTSLTYSLRYTYDLAQHEVHWEPRLGARDAVRGTAQLAATETGTRITYKLEQGAARTTGDLVLGGPHAIVGAFVRWIEAQP
jgi:uncharacterized protein YndB with AHSA1/START domain